MKERKKKRQALTNRKTAAAQARMKTISNLANDQPPPKRRKKGNEGWWPVCGGRDTKQSSTIRLSPEEDDFGADDEDWAVYREIVSLTPLFMTNFYADLSGGPGRRRGLGSRSR